MLPARLAACASLLAVLAFTGCGGSTPSQRPAVVAYLAQVQKVEQALGRPLATVTKVVAQVSGGSKSRHGLLPQLPTSPGSEQAKLIGALHSIRDLAQRLAAIPAPPPAARLRTLLLRLAAAEGELTDQTARLIVFLPALPRVLRPLAPANLRLGRVLAISTALGASGVTAALRLKAAALRRFQMDVGAILQALTALRPPRVSEPEYRSEISALRGMRAAAGRLAVALLNPGAGNLTSLLAAFDRAAAVPGSLSTQRAEIAAVRRYDASVAALNHLSVSVARERLHLDSTLR